MLYSRQEPWRSPGKLQKAEGNAIYNRCHSDRAVGAGDGYGLHSGRFAPHLTGSRGGRHLDSPHPRPKRNLALSAMRILDTALLRIGFVTGGSFAFLLAVEAGLLAARFRGEGVVFRWQLWLLAGIFVATLRDQLASMNCSKCRQWKPASFKDLFGTEKILEGGRFPLTTLAEIHGSQLV